MSLLADIQAECTSKECSVARVLRLCLQLAMRLKHAPLRQWVEHELNGYPQDAELPSYRNFKVRSRGFFADPFIGKGVLDVPLSVLPEDLRPFFETAKLSQPISHYESLLGQGNAQLPWPSEFATQYASEASSMECLRAWREIPSASIAGMIDTVKTKVLTMALDIEAQDPTAGDIPSTKPNISEATVSNIVNTNIYGGTVQNLAAGSTGITQVAHSTVRADDPASLVSHLLANGFEKKDADALVKAVADDKSHGASGIGPKAAAWLGKLGTGVTQGALVGTATKALLVYLGLS
jgi:hypothetical protein